MIEKLECTCIEAYKTRKMRDPNCCACSCDHNELVEQLAKANERVAELEKENKRESMELRSRLGSALGRNSEYNSAIENMQQKLAKANERIAELEAAIATAIGTFNKYEMDVDTYPTIEHVKMKNGLHECLNKFAIEQQIKGMQRVLDCRELNLSQGEIDTIKLMQEQLC